MSAPTTKITQRGDLKWLQFFAGTGGVLLTTLVFAQQVEIVSLTTIALAFLLIILLTATFVGRNSALLASFVGMLCFNYFFLPPVHTFSISGGQNLMAWAAFTITAVIAGELSAYARRRADEAVRQKSEIERLYEKLDRAFEKASRAEALKQSDKMKSALLDAVTHDLRTPLTAIKAAVTTLINDKTDANFQLDAESKREFLEIIDEETDRLNRQIEALVKLARIGAGQAKPNRETAAKSQPEAIVRAALQRAAKLLAEHQISLEIEPDLPALAVDGEAVSQVVYTLLENAAKYSPPRSQIVVTARRANDDKIKISVADEGRGVPLEMRERVFERFFRAELNESEKQKIGGLGMGLAIARGIVESNGGRIWIVDGINGRGTRVVFTLLAAQEI